MAFRNRVIVRVAIGTIVKTSIFFIIAFIAFLPLLSLLVKAFFWGLILCYFEYFLVLFSLLLLCVKRQD